MNTSSEIEDFVCSCENYISQAASLVESPKDFEKVMIELAEFMEENWEKFSALIATVNSQGSLDEQFKLRLNNIVDIIKVLEDKTVTKNDWVNEFKQYIIKSE